MPATRDSLRDWYRSTMRGRGLDDEAIRQMEAAHALREHGLYDRRLLDEHDYRYLWQQAVLDSYPDFLLPGREEGGTAEPPGRATPGVLR